MSKSRDEKLRDVERAAPLAGPEGEAAAVAAGVARGMDERDSEDKESLWDRGRRYKKNIQKVTKATTGNLWLSAAFIFTLPAFVYDALNAFPRAGGAMYQYIVVWAIIALLAYMGLKDQVDRKWLLRHCLLLTGVSLLLPIVLEFVAQFLSENAYAFAGLFLADLTAKSFWYVSVIAVYLLGWPNFIFTQTANAGGGIGKFANFLHVIAIIIIFLAALLPLGSALGDTLGGAAGASGYNYQPPSVWEMISDIGNLITSTSSSVISGVTGRVNESFGAATQQPYTGTVERQQGRLLGVSIRDVQATKPTFYFEKSGDQLSVGERDSQVLWFGTVQARTFADDMLVRMGCRYEYSPQGSSDTKGFSVDARPAELPVSYTGEYEESFGFDCALPMQKILSEAGTRAPYGQLYTTANFTFQTWGYSTISFMDRAVMTQLRRDGRDPSQVAGTSPRVQATYTPGPVSLGMLDKQPLPFGVDLQNQSRNYLPSFGITLKNSWYGRGEVTQVHKLTLQVPEPLYLKTDCFGYSDRIQQRVGSSTGEVPQGYTWYVFRDISFDEDEQLKTVRCPLAVKNGDWEDLLGADLSAKQFTLVARAEYDYLSKVPVSARLGVMQAE